MNQLYKIRVFIIDDEKLVLDDVAEELDESGLFDVVGTFTDLSRAIEAVDKLGPPDMVLCDIQLEGETGLKVTTLFSGICDFVVFMTGHPEFSEAAFRSYPEGCVYKPVTINALMPLVEKFYKSRNAVKTQEIIGGQIMVYCSREKDLRPIRVDDILYAESQHGYVSIVTEGKSWLSDISMGDLCSMLVPTGKFMRVSAKHMVAYSRISRIDNQVVYIGEKDFKVTALGRDAFDNYMQQVWGGRRKKKGE